MGAGVVMAMQSVFLPKTVGLDMKGLGCVEVLFLLDFGVFKTDLVFCNNHCTTLSGPTEKLLTFLELK